MPMNRVGKIRFLPVTCSVCKRTLTASYFLRYGTNFAEQVPPHYTVSSIDFNWGAHLVDGKPDCADVISDKDYEALIDLVEKVVLTGLVVLYPERVI